MNCQSITFVTFLVFKFSKFSSKIANLNLKLSQVILTTGISITVCGHGNVEEIVFQMIQMIGKVYNDNQFSNLLDICTLYAKIHQNKNTIINDKIIPNFFIIFSFYYFII